MWRRLFYSKFSILLLFIVFISIVFSTVGVYRKSREAAQKNDEVKSKLDKLRAKKDYFDSEVARLKTNAGIEEELRDKFQIAKPGEEVLIIVDDARNNNEETNPVKSKSWFWGIFGF